MNSNGNNCRRENRSKRRLVSLFESFPGLIAGIVHEIVNGMWQNARASSGKRGVGTTKPADGRLRCRTCVCKRKVLCVGTVTPGRYIVRYRRSHSLFRRGVCPNTMAPSPRIQTFSYLLKDQQAMVQNSIFMHRKISCYL